jgi:hypothetical protein
MSTLLRASPMLVIKDYELNKHVAGMKRGMADKPRPSAKGGWTQEMGVGWWDDRCCSERRHASTATTPKGVLMGN